MDRSALWIAACCLLTAAPCARPAEPQVRCRDRWFYAAFDLLVDKKCRRRDRADPARRP